MIPQHFLLGIDTSSTFTKENWGMSAAILVSLRTNYYTLFSLENRHWSIFRYWDWGLDWENVTTSPVWDDETGFGGNGNPAKGEPIVHGHCVDRGPFSALEIPYIDSLFHPHCLSRGFEDDEKLRNLSKQINPEALDKILASRSYNDFNLGLEFGPHNAIPRSIRGDFALFTAPSGMSYGREAHLGSALIYTADPVFFLHHTQLDRLWWRWQRANPKARLAQYVGKAAHGSGEKASLKDAIPMGDLAQSVLVSDIMDTESKLLCYRYWPRTKFIPLFWPIVLSRYVGLLK